MDRKFLAEKQQKKRKAKKGAWILILLAIAFILVFIRFAMNGSKAIYFNGLPGDEDAYKIGQQFIRPTVKSTGLHFPDSGYEFGKQSDSVYIIKSYYETPESGRTNYKLVLKYKGGRFGSTDSWDVESIDQGQ